MAFIGLNSKFPYDYFRRSRSPPRPKCWLLGAEAYFQEFPTFSSALIMCKALCYDRGKAKNSPDP